MLSAQAKALDDGRQLGSLADGALGVQLRRHVGTAYDMHRLARPQMAGVGRDRGLDLLAGGRGELAYGAEVVLDVAGALVQQ